MSSGKNILGHIDCPTCGTKAGMRITHDKNGEPFGYCEANCSQQLRIGGDKRRVRDFVNLYPWAAAPGEPVTAPKPAPDPVTVTATKPAPKPVPAPAPAKPKQAAGVFDFLLTKAAP